MYVYINENIIPSQYLTLGQVLKILLDLPNDNKLLHK